jgi:hypothetical protein
MTRDRDLPAAGRRPCYDQPNSVSPVAAGFSPPDLIAHIAESQRWRPEGRRYVFLVNEPRTCLPAAGRQIRSALPPPAPGGPMAHQGGSKLPHSTEKPHREKVPGALQWTDGGGDTAATE